MSLVGIAVLAVGMLAGVAGASGNTTSVSFIALSPPKVILSNAAIATKKTSSPVVIGGSTTVPSNATTVQITVSAKGPSIGTLRFYPALNPTGGSGQTLSYPGSNVVATTTIQENVGQAGELTIYNDGIGTATVTAKIIGYSTQVTAGDINGVGGTSGQVLTNDGNGGAAWQTLHTPSELVAVQSIVGYAGNYPAGTSSFQLNGATGSVSAQAGDTIQATVSSALGSTNPSAITFYVEMCYLAPNSTMPTTFSSGNEMIVSTVPGDREVYTSSGTFPVSQTGTYKVGLCVYNPAFSAGIDSNDWTNGSISVFRPGS